MNLVALLVELRNALEDEWESAHSEYCGGWPHPDVDPCMHPRPGVLDAVSGFLASEHEEVGTGSPVEESAVTRSVSKTSALQSEDRTPGSDLLGGPP